MYKKAQKLLLSKGLDALIVADIYNRRYLSGFTGSTGMLYLTANRQVILTDFRYMEQVNKECKDFQAVEVKGAGYVDALNALMKEDQVISLGFEDEIIGLKEYQIYESKGIQKELIPLGNGLTHLRCIKEPWELERIRQAEQLCDLAFSHILNFIKPGVKETDIALELEYTMKKNGASGLSFDTIVASGVNGALPHAHPTTKKVEHGDLVTMDFGCIYEGYCSDMTRTIAVGKVSEEQVKVYDIVRQAQLDSLAVIKAGVSGNYVDSVARELIKNESYGSYFGHGLGHSVGLFVHEEPRCSPMCYTILEENMLMTVEPGIYLPGKFGVRIEDLVVVTADGYENLSKSTKELVTI